MSKVTVIGIVGNSAFLPVENFHIGGETVEALDCHFEYGGKGFNQAIAAARFGAEVSFIATIGNEGQNEVTELLEKEGIKPCLVKKNAPTDFAAIITDKSGRNRVTVFHGTKLSTEDISAFAEEIKAADVLLINNEVPLEVNLKTVEIAVQNNVKIILNPAPYRENPKSLLDKVTYFTPNEHEANGLENYNNVIQTLGNKGCFIKAENITVSATKEKAVDTTGAGDTFNGVLAAEIANGTDIKTAVNYAVKASGKSVTKNGVISSIPFKSELI